MAMTSDPPKESNVLPDKLELVAILTILITLFLHSVSVRLEKILKRHKHLSEMLQHLYRELMVLGLISFALFTFEKSDLELFHDRNTFETVHILVFVIAIGYTILTLLLMALSVQISKRWDRLEAQDHSDYLEIKNDFDSMRLLWSEYNLLQRIFYIGSRLKYFQLVEQLAFHDLRLHFLHSNHLSQSTFSFARYLRKCKSHVLLQFGDIHSACWISLLIILILDIVCRNSIIVQFTDRGASLWYFRVTLITLGVSLCIVALLVFAKTKRILSHILCHSEMIDFDPIAAQYYIDHWKDHEEESPEDSISYAFDDFSPHRNTVHFTAESAVRRVARTFQIDQWGQKESSPPEILIGMSSDQPEQMMRPRLDRVQSLHVVEFSQLNLFWMNSHVFMLRLMQVCLFLVVFYTAVVVRFFTTIFESSFFLCSIALAPVFIPFMCFSFTLPVYTIIIHVGQLVDLDIVIEAREKATTKSNQDLDRMCVMVAPAQLRRASTLMLMSKSDRIRLQVSVAIFSSSAQTTVSWLILLHATMVVAHLTSRPFLNDSLMAIMLCIIPVVFVAEMGVKLYAAGPQYFLRSPIVTIDLLTVLAALIAAVLQLVNLIDSVFTIILLVRLVQIFRVARIGRIMRHQKEDQIEAEIGNSEIEMQMKITKEKIIDAVCESEDSSNRPSDLVLRARPRSMSLSALSIPSSFAPPLSSTNNNHPNHLLTTLKLNFDQGQVEVPVDVAPIVMPYPVRPHH